MSRDKPVLRALKPLSLIERNANGLRVRDMAEQLGTTPRAIYRDLEVLEKLPVQLYTDKNGKESYWKIDADFRNRLSIPFTLSELLSLYFAQDSIRPLQPVYNDLNGLNGSIFSEGRDLICQALVVSSFAGGVEIDMRHIDIESMTRVFTGEESRELRARPWRLT